MSLRIGSGAYKGRKLLPPPGEAATRPMTGAAKKSLFGVLGPDLPGASVLDLYCGTGTLGLEALSRGAGRCCFADRSRGVLSRLRRNIDALGAGPQCEVRCGDVEARLAGWLEELGWAVDVAFVDPPYATARGWSWPLAAERIFVPLGERLAAEGVVVLRTPGDAAPPPQLGPLTTVRSKRHGEMLVTLLAREIGSPPAATDNADHG